MTQIEFRTTDDKKSDPTQARNRVLFAMDTFIARVGVNGRSSWHVEMLDWRMVAVLAIPLAMAEDAVVERWDRAVCLHTEQRTTDGNRLWLQDLSLITRKRSVARFCRARGQDTHARTRLIYRRARANRVGFISEE